jgi:hypothetical protein
MATLKRQPDAGPVQPAPETRTGLDPTLGTALDIRHALTLEGHALRAFLAERAAVLAEGEVE